MLHELQEPATEVSFLSLDDLASRIGDRLEFIQTGQIPTLEILSVSEYCRLMDLIAASQPFQRYRDGNYQEPTCFEPDDQRILIASFLLNQAASYQKRKLNSSSFEKCSLHQAFCYKIGAYLLEGFDTDFKLSLPDIEDTFSWFAR